MGRDRTKDAASRLETLERMLARLYPDTDWEMYRIGAEACADEAAGVASAVLDRDVTRPDDVSSLAGRAVSPDGLTLPEAIVAIDGVVRREAGPGVDVGIWLVRTSDGAGPARVTVTTPEAALAGTFPIPCRTLQDVTLGLRKPREALL